MKLKLWKKRKEPVEERTVDMEPDDRIDLIDEDVVCGYSSIIGARKNQQDACFVEHDPKNACAIGIVCDGMGGLEGGATASSRALDYVVKALRDIGEDEINEKLEMIAEDADEIIAELTDDEGRRIRAGTTLAAVLIKGRTLHWVSVGDSKIYILKNGALQCVTDQHNYKFMADRRKNHRNFTFDPNVRQDALVSYLGAGGLPYIDISPDDLMLDDRDMVLICSDGLYNTLSDVQIREIMLDSDLTVNGIAEKLTAETSAQRKSGQDNTTAVVLQYRRKL